MSNLSEIHRLLKEGTQTLHDQTEEVMNAGGMMEQTYTPTQYIRFLQIQHAFHLWLEQHIKAYPALMQDASLDWMSRKRGYLVLADLEKMGSQPLVSSIPYEEVSSEAEMWGILYVAEGSTLGGNVIRKALKRNPVFQDIHAYTFLGCYGNTTGQKWKEFLQALEEAHRRLGSTDTFLTGAKRAFRILMDYSESVVSS